MPRFKTVHKGLKHLPIDFSKQLLPGTFEHALCYLVAHELDLSDLHARYRNSVLGAPAYDPAVLLTIVQLAYSRGIISSRKMEAGSRDHVLLMVISGGNQLHFTTLAHFVSRIGDLAAKLFAQVLAVYDLQGLIGREMFATVEPVFRNLRHNKCLDRFSLCGCERVDGRGNFSRSWPHRGVLL